VQDTFVAALRSRGRFNGESSVRTSLLSILKHKIVDHCRRTAAVSRATDVESDEGSDSLREHFFDRDGL
jgi:RNA polymerase sigma-70 factor (ECF subfamily)